jgi:Tol biopolymer transport system component
MAVPSHHYSKSAATYGDGTPYPARSFLSCFEFLILNSRDIRLHTDSSSRSIYRSSGGLIIEVMQPGKRIAPYEILSAIGKGGMGEVWRARDTQLGRDVAIKSLPREFALDTDRLARFEREARLLASLNHPNIASIYGLEKSDGTTVLVMELVEGPTLADRLKEGAIPLDESLAIGRQIADALEAAHERGITHRDLKPGNIKIRPDGMVKVLDFGLAKFGSGATPGEDLQESPTLSMAATQPGVILGTAAYMAPEQARGRPVDKRADIWAFGVVLYEMLTGARLFQGEDLTETLASVVKEQPDLSGVPVSVRRLLERCLEKDPKKRLRDIGDIELLMGEAEALPVSRGGGLRQWVWIAATGALTLALAALSFVYFRETAQPTLLATIAMPQGTTVLQGLAISPDGRFLVMAPEAQGRRQLWLRSMDVDRLQPMPDTDDAVQPFWSPDSRNIAFFANGKLKKVALSGGPVQSLCNVDYPFGGSWSNGDVIVFSRDRGMAIQRVEASGGTPVDVIKDQGGLRYPVFLPDGRRFLYLALGGPAENSGIFVNSLDGTEKRLILADVSRPVFAPPAQRARTGQILFIRENTLMTAPFDASSARIAGDALPLAEGATSPTASDDGVLLYSMSSGTRSNQIGWYDRDGKFLGPVGAPGAVGGPAISHDEKSVVFTRSADLWVYDVNRGTETRLTASRGQTPFWSPQDDRIVFQSNRTGGSQLYQRSSSPGGTDELLLNGKGSSWPTQWSRDGKYIVYFEAGISKNKRDIWVLPTDGNREPIPFMTTEADEFMGQLSPDNRWMAFTSDRSGRDEVYVRSFPSGEGERLISVSGGRAPRWNGDGKELYFIGENGKLTSVSVRWSPAGTKPAFEAGPPVELFDTHVVRAGNDTLFQYDVTADGKRFLINTNTSSAESTLVLTVVTNWADRLRK